VAVTASIFSKGSKDAHSTVSDGGQVILGGVLSSTKMTWMQELELPQASVALQVRLMVISCAQTVLGIITSVEVIVGAASQRSVAVATPLVPPGAVLESHSMVISGGHVINGGVVSCTAIVALHVAELRQSSVAVHVLVTL